MDVNKRKEEVKEELNEILKDAKLLISNIEKALEKIEKVQTLEEAVLFDENIDIHKGLKHIELY